METDTYIFAIAVIVVVGLLVFACVDHDNQREAACEAYAEANQEYEFRYYDYQCWRRVGDLEWEVVPEVAWWSE